MERASRSYLNGKELLVVVVIPLELSDQLRIVFERTDHLALLCRADCRNGRRLSIAIAIDEVTIVLREASAIDASLSRQDSRLAPWGRLEDSSLGRRLVSSLVVDVALAVTAVEVDNVPLTLRQALLERSIRAILIELRRAVPLAQHDDAIGDEAHRVDKLIVDISRVLLTKGQSRRTALRIDAVHLEIVLQTIERDSG